LIVFIATVCGVTIAETPIKDNEYVIFYHNDILGSPIAVSDGKGRVLWYENTGPYGEVLGRNASDGITSVGNPIVESADSRIGFTGHEKDNTSSLTYMKARHYDPILGRFYSNDPVGPKANDPQAFNRYGYAANSPYIYTDPDGQEVRLAVPMNSPTREAYNNLRHYDVSAQTISTLEASKNVYTIREPDAKSRSIVSINGGNPFARFFGFYDPIERSIHISPGVRAEVGEEGKPDPTTVSHESVLYHELGHAYIHETTGNTRQSERDIHKMFDNFFNIFKRDSNNDGGFIEPEKEED